MGLDAYFMRVHKDAITTEVDFSTDGEKYNVKEVNYFRKNSVLQGWMHALYKRKGGTDVTFNCCNVVVTLEDLKQLLEDLRGNKVEPTQGFFFGSMDEYKYAALYTAVIDMIAEYDSEYIYFYYAWY